MTALQIIEANNPASSCACTRLKRLLQHKGVKVGITPSGQNHSLKYLRYHRPDAVFMDPNYHPSGKDRVNAISQGKSRLTHQGWPYSEH